MEAIYDTEGRAVGWRQRTAIFDSAGKPRAFISQRCVFTYQGQFLGRFEDRWYRDPDGHAVAFEAGASGGPLPPLIRPGAVPPITEPDPPPPQVEAPPPRRMRSSRWSARGWDEFLAGEAATTRS